MLDPVYKKHEPSFYNQSGQLHWCLFIMTNSHHPRGVCSTVFHAYGIVHAEVTLSTLVNRYPRR